MRYTEDVEQLLQGALKKSGEVSAEFRPASNFSKPEGPIVSDGIFKTPIGENIEKLE